MDTTVNKEAALYFGLGILLAVIALLASGVWAWRKFDVDTKLKLRTLHPRVRRKASKLLAKAKKAGLHIIITEAERSCRRQNTLFAQGRTTGGAVVTNARCCESDHNFKMAFDVVQLFDGKADYNRSNWDLIGKIGESVGLTWGGRWSGFQDRPHFYDLGNNTHSELERECKLAA